MSKNIRLIILAVLVVIMVLVWSSFCQKFKRAKVRPKRSALKQNTLELAKDFVFWADKAPKKRLESRFKAWGKNPFTLAKGLTVSSGMNLMGILWDKDFPQAIINNVIVRVGDSIEGNKVTTIHKDRVILSDGQNTFELKLR